MWTVCPNVLSEDFLDFKFYGVGASLIVSPNTRLTNLIRLGKVNMMFII